MTVERSYRLPESDSEHCYTPVTDGRCRECFQRPQRCAVPDSRLQAIEDAYQATLDEAPYLNTGGVPRLLRTEAPELAALLDALAEEER